MTDLKSISGIGKTSLELLEAAGILDARTLADAGVDELTAELERANRILRIAKRTPRKADVEKWITNARKKHGLEPLPNRTKPEPSEPAASPAGDPPTNHMPVNYEITEEVRELLAAAPAAIPLPARQLIDAGVKVSEIPPAILLNRCAGDLEIRVNDRKGPRGIPRSPILTKSRAAAGSYVQVSDPSPPRLQLDTTRLRAISDLDKAKTRVPATRAAPVANGMDSSPTTTPETDRVALLRSPLEATNRGRDPQSRLYIRGVLHSHPWSMMFGAIITLVMMILTVPALLAAALLLLSDILPEQFYWVSPWLLVPCALPVVGILYLIYGVKGKCRICNQRLFFPRACLKNKKAHRIPGLGYIIPVSLHMLIFRWFRCTHCGTPVRLKK